MKILFIHANNSIALFENANPNDQESNDYLTDALFLEAKNRKDFDVYECPYMSHMYKNSKTEKSNITGLAFTLRKKIECNSNVLPIEDAIYKIKNNFFDLIFTDSRTMNKWWSDRGISPFFNNAQILKKHILLNYPKEKIIFLDGEDQTDSIQRDFYQKSLYFKRELATNDKNLIPIGYSFPQQYFKKSSYEEKTKSLATIIPGIKSTYIFNNENDFYEDYRNSLFGLTWKKLGWDCFRHHEIIFSSCLPIFPDINECPENTLTKFPKEACKRILKLDCLKKSKHLKRWIAHDLYYFENFFIDNIKENEYNEILEELLNFSFENNTSKKMLDYVLNFTK